MNRQILLHPGCELCHHPQLHQWHQPDWRHGHKFEPHYKHKLKFEHARGQSMGWLETIYRFRCEVCGYRHDVMKNDMFPAKSLFDLYFGPKSQSAFIRFFGSQPKQSDYTLAGEAKKDGS